MKKLLALLGSLTMVGTAGATVVACGNSKQAQPTEIETQALVEKIKEALELLANSNKREDAKSTFLAAINEAQNVLVALESQTTINDAVVKLEAAIQAFKNAPGQPTEIETQALVEKIKEALELLANSNKREDAKSTFLAAINEAQNVLVALESQTTINDAVVKLEAAIQAFKNAPGQPTEIETQALVEKIKEALELLANSNKREDAKSTFLAAINEAQNVLVALESQTTINDAVVKLEAAIQAFKNAPGQPTEIETQALVEKIKEALELLANSNKREDAKSTFLAAINEAQNVLVALESQTTINDAVVKLEAAIQAFKNADEKTDYSELQAAINNANKWINDNEGLNLKAEVALKEAIMTAHKIVADENASQIEVDDAVTTLNIEINKFKDAILPYQNLNKKIKEVKEAQQEITEKSEWGGPVASAKTKLETVIDSAIKATKDPELNNEKVAEISQELDNAISEFKLSLPENIVSEAINREKADIQNRVDKGWTYSEFWSNEGDRPSNENKRLIDTLDTSVEKIAKNQDYDETEITDLQSKVKTWAKSNVSLVYIDIDVNGNQVVKETIKSDEKGTLEDIFLNKVKTYHTDMDEPGFWTDPKGGAKLSLGIAFAKNAPGERLPDETKDFWTFTFAGEFNEDVAQKIVDERQAEGPIIIDIEKGLSDGGFWSTLGQKLRAELLYDRCLIPQKLFFGFTRIWVDNMPAEKRKNGGKAEIKNAELIFKGLGTEFLVHFDCIVNII